MVRFEKESPWITKDIRFDQHNARDIGCGNPHHAPLRPLVYLLRVTGVTYNPDSGNRAFPNSPPVSLG
jgi:hypothetical protein